MSATIDLSNIEKCAIMKIWFDEAIERIAHCDFLDLVERVKTLETEVKRLDKAKVGVSEIPLTPRKYK